MENSLKLWVNYNPKECRDQSNKVLQQLLMHYSNSDKHVKILRTESGKPYVQEPIQFSYSHSHGVYLYCVTKNGQVGVDVEKINPLRPYMQLAKRYFHPAEVEFLIGLDKPSRLQSFFQMWTTKEAVCKCHGGNLWSYLKLFVLPIINHSSDVCDDLENKKTYAHSSLRFQGYAFTVSSELPIKKILINTIG